MVKCILFLICLLASSTSFAAQVILQWSAPLQREDNSSLPLNEISGYKIYYGVTPNIYTDNIYVTSSTTITRHTVNLIYTDTYYFVITTIDTDGRESVYSQQVSKSVIGIEPPVDEIFPIILEGTAPQEKSITIVVNKPANVTQAIITLNVYDPDFTNEGELIVNGNTPISLFGSHGIDANDAITTTISFTTDATYWVDGDNILLFKHTRTFGYKINSIVVNFEGIIPSIAPSKPTFTW